MKIDEQSKVARVRSQIEETMKKNVIEFLRDNYDAMAWPPFLTRPKLGDELQINLATFDTTINVVLVKEEAS